MSNWVIEGGRPLQGEVVVQGAKNAALPILAATLLVEAPIRLLHCPRLRDVENMCEILTALGCRVHWESDALVVDASTANQTALPDALSGKLRSSIFLLGSVLARFGEASAPYPGGCEIGQRPVDLHLFALRRLSAEVEETGGRIVCRAKRLLGNTIDLDYPSVGATENGILAACRAEGETVIRNAAREPEIVDLERFLNACGFAVRGAGTSTVTVSGRRKGHGASHRVMGDRIAAGTYLLAGAMTRGSVTVQGISPSYLDALTSKLVLMGATVSVFGQEISVSADRRLCALDRLETLPYPGFPTDMQAQMFSALSVANGTSVLVEHVFENRFKHAMELRRLGANNTVRGRIAVVTGVERLVGTTVTAHDLRGGAALVLAGLVGEGQTVVERAELVERGYERMDVVIRALGGRMERKDGTS